MVFLGLADIIQLVSELMAMKFDLEYAKSVIRAEATAVLSVCDSLSKEFHKALEMIYQCRGSVILSGLGKAGIIAQKISATLASTGTPSHFLHPVEAMHGDLGRLRSDDVVIVLSNGGETAEVTRLVELVKRQSLLLISITGKADSTLSKYSDVVLCFGNQAEACPLGVAPSVSTTCMLAIGDAIALTVMKARELSIEDYVKFHPGGSLGAKLMTVEQSMMFKSDEKLPVVSDKCTIKEMLADTVDVKRHGATMVINDIGKLVGIITDADMRRLMAKEFEKGFDTKVIDVMTAECKRICCDSLAAEAMAMFHKYRIDELPVVDADGKPIGLIDVQDIVTIKIVG